MRKLTLTDLSDAIVLALIRRALADLYHDDSGIREEALRFVERMSSRALLREECQGNV